jgi:serine/threonine-protein kinase
MSARLLRLLGYVAYAGAVLLIFIATGYLSFNRFVRSGATTVPSVVGLTEQGAIATLADSGLDLRTSADDQRFDETMPAGRILQQDPTAGSVVKQGASVEVIVSLGQQLVEVPDLTGQALQAAQVTLSAAGLALGRTSGVFSATGVPGTVVDQNPGPGDQVGRAQAVELYLCLEGRSETFVMPDLAYRNFDDVRSFFERRGFRLGSVKFESYEGISPGVVLRQYPQPGHPLKRQDVISLVVATLDRMQG